MRGIYKDPVTGMWVADVRKKGFPRERKYCDTQAKAIRWKAATLTAMDNGTHVPKGELPTDTVKELFEKYMQEESPNKKGAKKEINRIKLILKEPFASKKVSELDKYDIREWRDRMKKKSVGKKVGLSSETIHRRVKTVSAIYNHAIKEWRGFDRLINPTTNVSLPTIKEKDKRDRILINKESDALFSALSESDNPDVYDFCIIAHETAMRAGEILKTTIEMIDLSKGLIRLPSDETKNEKGRTVPLSQKALEAVKRRVDSGSTPHIFGQEDKDRQRIESAFSKAKKSAGIKNFRIHDFRHVATTNLARIYDVLRLALITGHSDTRMLMRYYNPTEDDLLEPLRNKESDFNKPQPSNN